ncbi:MAG: serine/threonine-protein kinase [Planctomycetota bacterium]
MGHSSEHAWRTSDDAASGRLPRAAERVAGYIVLRELARGGMGAVFVARDPAGRDVALKVLLPGVADERFALEAQALARLDHPGVVRVHSHGTDERGRVYLVMDLVPGAPLDERLRAGPLGADEAVDLALELCAALEHAHAQGVVHRDLKPSNVLLVPGPRGTRAVLADFGVAHVSDRTEALTRTGELLGTPSFMAPEQASGAPVSAATDVYALGATLYAMLTGAPPFLGEPVQVLFAVLERAPRPPRELAPGLDPALEAIVLRCLEKQPAARFSSAGELAQALAAWRRGEATAPRGRAAAFAVAALLLAALGAAAWGASPGGDPPPAPTSTSSPPSSPGVDANAAARPRPRRGTQLFRGKQDPLFEFLDAEWAAIAPPRGPLWLLHLTEDTQRRVELPLGWTRVHHLLCAGGQLALIGQASGDTRLHLATLDPTREGLVDEHALRGTQAQGGRGALCALLPQRRRLALQIGPERIQLLPLRDEPSEAELEEPRGRPFLCLAAFDDYRLITTSEGVMRYWNVARDGPGATKGFEQPLPGKPLQLLAGKDEGGREVAVVLSDAGLTLYRGELPTALESPELLAILGVALSGDSIVAHGASGAVLWRPLGSTRGRPLEWRATTLRGSPFAPGTFLALTKDQAVEVLSVPR